MTKIITTGRLGKEFFDAIVGMGWELEIKFVDVPIPGDIKWADCLAAFTIPEEINVSTVRWIHSFGAGIESFLHRKDIGNRTILTRTVGNLGIKMGEFCLCHILNFFQNTFSVYENKKLKRWELLNPRSLIDKSILLLGTGEMARGIVSVLHPMKLRIIGVNTDGRSPDRGFFQCLRFNQIEAAAGRISCIINTLPLTPKSEGLLNGKFFEQFHDVLFINVGRGKSVVTEDLIAAIDRSNISFAVLDVFDREPLPAESPLWDNSRIYISPHQGARTDIHDIIDSFLEAYRMIKSNKRNRLFIDFERGY
jgi:glyoxylate/hydroxypyruvate reductase